MATGVYAWCAVATLTGVLCASAQAAPGQTNPHGKFLGVVGHRPPSGATAPGGASTPNAASTGNLSYYGGPVMHADANYAIFWEPAGRATTSSYKSTIQTYFANVAADSGKATNVYAIDSEYYDTVSGAKQYAAYSATYGGTLLDTQPYPANGCPPQNGAPCLTDAQIATEINRVITANHLPRGLGAAYYVFFPPNVGSCFDSTSSSCSFTYFCAYHSSFSNSLGTVLYADMPYAAVPGCDPAQRPNADPADATLNVLSHENNETITDPLGNAWFDAQGNENGDKCNFVFGSPLGGGPGSYYNQLINARGFWLQEEWSNAAGGCLQRPATAPPTDENPTASFTSTSPPVTAGSPVAFNASGSSDPDGTINTYNWSFGDGTSATGATASHTYTTAGTYTATLTVTDSGGLSASASRAITISSKAPAPDENPTASFTFSGYAYPYANYVRFSGAGSDPDGSISGYTWTFGDGTSAVGSISTHRFPRTGTYTVTLTVRDSAGLTASATHSVTIR